MGAPDEPNDESEDSTAPSRAFGSGAGHAKLAKVAKVAAAETVAEIVDGIVDDPFQDEITRKGGVMDGVLHTTHTAWHEMTSAVHHLGGAEHGLDEPSAHGDHVVHDDAPGDLHSTIHDQAEHHGHVADVTHDHAIHPPDHAHPEPHH